jgi:NDP-sugar pyrophosphorylase family protein
MQAVILAGGLATRLGELSRDRPKSMIPVCGRPFLAHQLDFLRAGGIDEVVLCVGHLKDQIIEHFGDGRDYGVSIRYSSEDRLLGTAGALKNAEALLRQAFFTIYGDSYLLMDFPVVMTNFLDRHKLALMTVLRNDDRYDRSNTAIDGGLVTRYDKKNRAGLSYIDYGANLFRREALDLIPAGVPYPMEAFLPRLIEKGELAAYEVTERFYEIGSAKGLAECMDYLSAAVPRRAT